MGGLGPFSGLVLVVLGRSQGLCGRSWAALGAYVGGLGTLLGVLWAVLGHSKGLCGRSWPLLGLHRALLGPVLAVLAALGAYVGNPGRPWAEKWPKPEREQGPRGAWPVSWPSR